MPELKTKNELNKQLVTRIITRLLYNKPHRTVIQEIIDEQFLSFTIEFFKEVASAKLESKDIDIDWYKSVFIHENIEKKDIAWHSGLNLKSINNIYNTTRKEIVLDASLKHYDEFNKTINSLLDTEIGSDITLTIKFKGISVDLNINESLIVINALAVKRSALTGGLWSSIGKNIEKPLMETLCKLYGVSDKYYSREGPDSLREVDFYLIDSNSNYRRCEVKLMGKGNPESADVIFARDTEIFIGETLSETNMKQLDDEGIYWIHLGEKEGYKKFESILDSLNIPHGKCMDISYSNLNKIFDEIDF